MDKKNLFIRVWALAALSETPHDHKIAGNWRFRCASAYVDAFLAEDQRRYHQRRLVWTLKALLSTVRHYFRAWMKELYGSFEMLHCHAALRLLQYWRSRK